MRNAALLLLVLVLGAVPLSQFSAAAQDAQTDSTVIAVYDATASSECQIEIQVNDGPWTPVACPPGTLIQAEEMPLDQVLARGYSYIPISGDEAVDRQLALDLMAAVHYAVAPPPSGEHEHGAPVASYGRLLGASSASNLLYGHCYGEPRVNVNGSYLVGPEGGTRYRAYWALGYSFELDCDLFSIRDRAKVGPSGYGQIRWGFSCADNCSNRNRILVDDWTPVYAVDDWAPEDTTYFNYGYLASCNYFCTSYSGWWKME
jgi:hypothetical protein